MTERSFTVRLRAEVGDFKREMASAQKAVEQAIGGMPGQARQAESAMTRLSASARNNEQEWRTAGRTFLTAGLAITGVGAAALKTGISYNTLQQTSRAALRTLLGGAEAANAQMDKLDEFARTSPFAKQVFINAQRQMLGFGIEARKVIPYMDAIQNAVAATGGSNQDIAELSRIISQISATSKITAMDLREFGNRGVDAATIIGSQMGKTGAQIREDITAGTLDAQVAIDALAAGMQDRFGGAAANVKETFDGAFDRVKAAWRDLSSALAEPLVGTEGGGLLTDKLNELADAMRAFEDLPAPVKNTAAALVGLAGAGSLAAGAFLLGLPKYLAFKDALLTIAPAGTRANTVLTGTGRALSQIGLAATAVLATAAATGMLVDKLKGGEAVLAAEALKKAIRDMARTDDIDRLSAQFTNFGKVLGADVVVGVDDLGSALDKVLAPGKGWTEFGFITQEVTRLGGALPGVTSSLEVVQERFASLDQILTSMVQSGEVDTVRAVLDQIYTDAQARGYTIDEVNGLFAGTQDALIGVDEAASGATEGFEQLDPAIAAAAEALADWVEMVAGANDSFINLQSAYDSVIEKNKAMAQASADATKTSKDSWEDFYDGVSVSAAEWIASLEEQVAAQVNWQDNLVAISERVQETLTGDMRETADAMIDELIKLGPEGAAQVELLRTMSDAELQRMVELYGIRGGEAGGTYGQELADRIAATRVPDIPIGVDTSGAQQTLDQFIATARSRSIRIQTIIDAGGNSGAGLADGGQVPGWSPHPKADNVPIMATAGEFMQPVRSVRFWGPGFHEAVRTNNVAAVKAAVSGKTVAGFADGGWIGRRAMAAASGRGAGSRTIHTEVNNYGRDLAPREITHAIRAAEVLDPDW